MSAAAVRVLVTALGGNLGQAVVKSLRLGGAAFEVLGCDAEADGVGPSFVERFTPVPAAAEGKQYLDALNSFCRREGIAAVIPASEAEIEVLADWPRLESGAAVICQPRDFFQTYADKLRSMHNLSGQLELVRFADGSDAPAVERLVSEAGFPVVVKGRRSSGSRQVRCAATPAELKRHLAEIPNPVVQQHIDDSGGEFSVGVFASEGFTEAIALKRRLQQVGCSWHAETCQDSEVLDYALRFARASKLRGAANLQVRKSQQGVRLLEVNPRFSSLAAARAFCGFRDVEWSVRSALGMPSLPRPGTYKQIRFERFFHEVLDWGEGYAGVAEWSPRLKTGQ